MFFCLMNFQTFPCFWEGKALFPHISKFPSWLGQKEVSVGMRLGEFLSPWTFRNFCSWESEALFLYIYKLKHFLFIFEKKYLCISFFMYFKNYFKRIPFLLLNRTEEKQKISWIFSNYTSVQTHNEKFSFYFFKQVI